MSGLSLHDDEKRRRYRVDGNLHWERLRDAMQVVNSIPALCAAEPGMRGAFELNNVYAGIGYRRT